MRLLGFAPDLDPTTEGVIVECDQFVPSVRGMTAGPTPEATSLPALTTACVGSAILAKLDNSTRLFAGTVDKIFEATSTTVWTDRSAVTSYGLTTGEKWRFAQFGNVSLSTAKSVRLQASTTGAFADAATSAPKASIVETIGNFVFLADTNESTYGDSPDRWWCSGIGDYTDWTPAVATQCTTGRLTSSSGSIRALRRLGELAVAYKDRSMFIGQYVGPPVVWDWREVSNAAGALCQEVVVPVTLEDGGYLHVFMGTADFYVFDGSRPMSIGAPVREWVFGRINRDNAKNSVAYHDIATGNVYFYFPTTTAVCDTCVVWNYRSKRWGRADRSVEAVVDYSAAGITYDDLGGLYSTYNDLGTGGSYDLAFSVNAQFIPAYFDTTHRLQTLTGTPGSSSFTTGDIGNEVLTTTISRVMPRWLTRPTSAQVTNYYRQQLGDGIEVGPSAQLSNGRFDLMNAAKWHRFTYSFGGAVEIQDVLYKFEMDGDD